MRLRRDETEDDFEGAGTFLLVLMGADRADEEERVKAYDFREEGGLCK
jgi:hypothetical protein